MYCVNCGFNLLGDVNFCPNCGHKVNNGQKGKSLLFENHNIKKRKIEFLVEKPQESRFLWRAISIFLIAIGLVGILGYIYILPKLLLNLDSSIGASGKLGGYLGIILTFSLLCLLMLGGFKLYKKSADATLENYRVFVFFRNFTGLVFLLLLAVFIYDLIPNRGLTNYKKSSLDSYSRAIYLEKDGYLNVRGIKVQKKAMNEIDLFPQINMFIIDEGLKQRLLKKRIAVDKLQKDIDDSFKKGVYMKNYSLIWSLCFIDSVLNSQTNISFIKAAIPLTPYEIKNSLNIEDDLIRQFESDSTFYK